MGMMAAILLLLFTPVLAGDITTFSNHFGACAPFELAKRVTMCNGHDETICVRQKVLDRKIAKGWTIGRCQSTQYCGDGTCDIDTGEECSNCPSDCASYTVCCQNGMMGTYTENCCNDCLENEQCVADAHSSGPGGSCVPN